MKIRQGYISNSSSSSFWIIGRKVKVQELTNDIISNTRIWVIGQEMHDGKNIFLLEDPKALQFLKALRHIPRQYLKESITGSDFKFYEELDSGGEGESVYGLMCNASTGNYEDLKWMVLDSKYANIAEQILLRKEKLKKLNKQK